MKKTVIQAGNSLAVTLPSKYLQRWGVKRGDFVEVFVQDHINSVTYKFQGNTQLSLIEKHSKNETD